MSVPYNQINRVPYLKTQWKFPRDDVNDLSSQVDKAYVDIASKVNARVIGIFPQSNMAVTGEQWFLNGNTSPSQTLRREYVFGAIGVGETDIPTNLPVNHGIFTRITGTVATSGGDYRPIPYIDPAGTTNSIIALISVLGGVESLRIVVGAGFPTIVNGMITLEWLESNDVVLTPG